MIRDLKSFYVAIKDNEVVAFETNLQKFVPLIEAKEKEARNYQWFYREFKKSTYFKLTLGGKDYFFQRVI